GAVSRTALAEGAVGEATAAVAARVAAARGTQRERLARHGWATNAEVPGNHLRALLGARSAGLSMLDGALDRGALSLRGADRVLRTAWTLADLAGCGAPGRQEIGQALALRTRGGVA